MFIDTKYPSQSFRCAGAKYSVCARVHSAPREHGSTTRTSYRHWTAPRPKDLLPTSPKTFYSPAKDICSAAKDI
jgi:hypothetical protein